MPSVQLPSPVVPSKTVTVPDGIVPSELETVAVNVTSCPNVAESRSLATTVRVPATTDWAIAAETTGSWFASPL